MSSPVHTSCLESTKVAPDSRLPWRSWSRRCRRSPCRSLPQVSLRPSVNICYPIALRDAVIYENALAFLAYRTPGPTTAAVFASSRGVSGYRRWPVCRGRIRGDNDDSYCRAGWLLDRRTVSLFPRQANSSVGSTSTIFSRDRRSMDTLIQGSQDPFGCRIRRATDGPDVRFCC